MTQEKSVLRKIMLPVLLMATTVVLGACVVAPYPGHGGGYRYGNGNIYPGNGGFYPRHGGFYPGNGGYQRGPGDAQGR